MNTEQMRAALLERYSGPSWAAKVAKMSDRQVYAVYMRTQNSPAKSWAKV